jgi:hypothetical protein
MTKHLRMIIISGRNFRHSAVKLEGEWAWLSINRRIARESTDLLLTGPRSPKAVKCRIVWMEGGK